MNKETSITFGGLLLGAVFLTVWNIAVRAKSQTFDQSILKTTESVVLRKEKAIRMRQAPVDVLFLGDSTVDSAIDETLFERESGLSCLNLGLAGDFGTYGDLFMLRSYLAKFPPPKAVVVWHTVDVWQRPLNYPSFAFTLPSLEDQWVVVKSLLKDIPMNQNILHWPLRTATNILLGGLYYVSPGYRYKVWMKALMNRRVPGLVPLNVVDGFPHERSASESKFASEMRKLQSLPVLISRDANFWFGRFLALAGQHGIPVFATRSPIHERAWKDPVIRQFLAEQNFQLHEYFKGFQLAELRRDNIVFEPDFSNLDKDHVNERGRAFVTTLYAKSLREQLVLGKEGRRSPIQLVSRWMAE